MFFFGPDLSSNMYTVPFSSLWSIIPKMSLASFKNAFVMLWAMELVQQGVMDFIRVSFMVAGHTKFEPDRVFSMKAKVYASSDDFSTEALATTVSPYAKPTVGGGKVFGEKSLLVSIPNCLVSVTFMIL